MAQVTATVGIKNSAFKRGLDEMRGHAKTWSGDMKGMIAGAFAFSAFTSFISNFVQEMARVKDLSDRLGESATTIQRVGNAAKMSGSDLEYVIKTMAKLTAEAAKSGEQFEAVGISAAEFLNSDTEGKILMLAKAYEEANGSQAKMLALSELLGSKGQDMLIMLAGGVAGLREALEELPTVSEDAVASMARLDDAITSVTQRSKVGFGRMIEWAKGAWLATKNVLSKGFTDEAVKGFVDELSEKDSQPTNGIKQKITSEDLADKSKQNSAAKALAEQAQALTRSRLDDEEKITALKAEQAALMEKAEDPKAKIEERLEAERESLKIQQEIEALQKSMADKAEQEAKKEADERKKKAEDADKAEKAVKEEERQQKLEAMTPEDRIKELKRQQAEAFASSDKKKQEEDRQGSAEDRLKGLQLNDDIARAQKEIDDAKKKDPPSIASSSMAAIGGGGGVFVTGTDPALNEARRQTTLLELLVRQGTGLQGPSGKYANPF